MHDEHALDVPLPPEQDGWGGHWTDPFAPKATSAEDFQWQTRRMTPRSGAFSDATAELVVDPRTIPHSWAIGEQLVLTVAGDADGDTLQRIAESLDEKEDE